MKIKFIILSFCMTFIYASSVFPQAVNQSSISESDALKLVRESFENQLRSNWRMSFEYTYKWLTTLKRKGKTETILQESYFPARIKRQGTTNSLSVVLARNGMAVAPEKIEKQRREISEKLEKAGNEREDKTKSLEDLREKGINYSWVWSNVAVGMHIYLGRCRFDSPQRETIDGRATITLRFQTCNTTDAPESYAYLSNIQGKIWLDEADKMPVRFEAYAKTSPTAEAASNSPSKSQAITFVQKKVAEGFWFPSLIRVAGIGNEMVFPKLNADREMEFSGYEQSQTEVKEIKVGTL